jgi:CheY-like chemotaxis protein
VKILIVDDEDDIRTIARMSLERIGGMSVLEAASGPEALEIAVREAPEAILLDVMMPEMDGTATLAALRANDETSAIPVVYLTAKALPGEVERLKALGALGVLTKPFEPMTLAQQVRDTLAGTSPGPDLGSSASHPASSAQ